MDIRVELDIYRLVDGWKRIAISGRTLMKRLPDETDALYKFMFVVILYFILHYYST